MEIINYNKARIPFLHKMRIQPIVKRNSYGEIEMIGFLGTGTALFEWSESAKSEKGELLQRIWTSNSDGDSTSDDSDDERTGSISRTPSNSSLESMI